MFDRSLTAICLAHATLGTPVRDDASPSQCRLLSLQRDDVSIGFPATTLGATSPTDLLELDRVSSAHRMPQLRLSHGFACPMVEAVQFAHSEPRQLHVVHSGGEGIAAAHCESRQPNQDKMEARDAILEAAPWLWHEGRVLEAVPWLPSASPRRGTQFDWPPRLATPTVFRLCYGCGNTGHYKGGLLA